MNSFKSTTKRNARTRRNRQLREQLFRKSLLESMESRQLMAADFGAVAGPQLEAVDSAAMSCRDSIDSSSDVRNSCSRS